MFVLPDELPATVAELDALRDKAQRSINVIQARHEAGEELTKDDVEALRGLLDAVDQIDTARTEAAEAEAEHQASVTDLMARAKGKAAQDADGPEATGDAGADAGTGEAADAGTDDGAESDAGDTAPEAVAAAGAPKAGGKTSFAGVGADDTPPKETGPGWEMVPGAPGFKAGRVGFRDIALAIDSVKPGSRAGRRPTGFQGDQATQVLARLNRDVEVVSDSHALVAAINDATDQTKLPGGALTASGWCAPSEQLYDFCDVPDAVDLISLPEITINRGGVRWPNEPDYSALYSFLGWHFTEAQLNATDADGKPTAIKPALNIPCPDEFTEIRLEAIGWSVESAILQEQGWPELIENFLRHATNGHLRGVSALTVAKMEAGSTAVDLTGAGASKYVSASTSILNGLALQAVNLRYAKGLARNATIEGVAPSWLAEVVKADFAQQEGLAVKDVTDAQVTSWLSARNIVLQYIADWQSRGVGQPGHFATAATDTTVAWPGKVSVLLYPAGTWFRAMSGVIELGVMYPRELLQVNRFTKFFTEDAIAVGKRCDRSIKVTLPLDINGGIGARISLA